MTPLYKLSKQSAGANIETLPTVSPHRLAILYIIFAIGSLVDLTQPAYNSSGEHYFHLCRAAMSLRSVFESPEICTSELFSLVYTINQYFLVQAVALIGNYYLLGGRHYNLDAAWRLVSLAAKLGQSVRQRYCL